MTKKQDEKIFDFFVIRFQLKNIAIAESPQLKGKSPCVRIQIHCVKNKIAADKKYFLEIGGKSCGSKFQKMPRNKSERKIGRHSNA